MASEACSSGSEPGAVVMEAAADGESAGLAKLELSIGEAAGASSEYQFARILSIAVESTGAIWVVDGGGIPGSATSPLVRQFNPDGTFVMQVGRVGAGPGEYREPQGVAVMRDGRVALRDARLPMRITVYSSDGVVSTAWSISPNITWPAGGIVPINVDTGGIVWLPFRGRPGSPSGAIGGFLRLRPDGEIIDTVPPVDLPEMERETVEVVRNTSSGRTATATLPVPYQPIAMWTWSPFGSLAVTRTDEYRIDVYPPVPIDHSAALGASRHPQPQAILRAVLPVQIEEPERSALRRGLEESVAAGGRAMRQDIPEMPRQKPLTKYMFFADDGQLVVSVHVPSRLRDGEWVEDNAWDVFDPGGKLKGRVVFPQRFYPLRMIGNHIWGVYRGALDVESVRQYGIVWK